MFEDKLDDVMSNKTKALIRFETLALFILGIVIIFFPHAAVAGFNYVFGTLCIFYGVAQCFYILKTNHAETPATSWIPFITALVSISVGIVMFIDGMFFAKTFLGIWLVAFGIFQIVRAFQQHKTMKLWPLIAFCGVASFFFALVMWFNWPVQGIENVGYFIGPNLIISAITIWYNNRSVFSSKK